MRILGIVLKTLVFAFIAGLLFACNMFNKNSQGPGITYVTSLGDPKADSIFWSPKDSTQILVNAIDFVTHNIQVYVLDVTTEKKTIIDYRGVLGNGWSPDGKQIALLVGRGTEGFSRGGVWMMNTEDMSLKLLSDEEGHVAWLPDGNTLALLKKDLASNQNLRQVSVYLMDMQTKDLKLIYSNQDAISFSGLSSSPDGNYLVFSLNTDYYSNASDLYILEVKTGVVNQLTNDGASNAPQWSPKGNLIVYVKSTKVDDRTRNSLHIFSPDESCDLEVPSVEIAFSPTWSPDGRKIAFIGDDGIYILDIDIMFGRDIYQNSCS